MSLFIIILLDSSSCTGRNTINKLLLCYCYADGEELRTTRFEAYTTSVYWVITTMTSTGYGDHVAHTILEMIFAIFVMIVGKAVFGLILANMAATMAIAGSYRVVYENKIISMRVSKLNSIKTTEKAVICIWEGPTIYFFL